MNQHNVQKAYLKFFADKSGKVWVYSKAGGRPILKSPAECAAAENFQSSELEFYQNRVIETPGIRALRASGTLSQREYEHISMWMALHILRCQKARQELFESTADYETRFHEELSKERLFSQYYKYVYTHKIVEPDFAVTSDDPVIEFACGDFFVRGCAVSPHKLIFFSPHEGRLEHELGLHDFFNGMMWGAPGERLYSHRPDLRVDHLSRIARDFDLRAVMEDVRFGVSASGDTG